MRKSFPAGCSIVSPAIRKKRKRICVSISLCWALAISVKTFPRPCLCRASFLRPTARIWLRCPTVGSVMRAPLPGLSLTTLPVVITPRRRRWQGLRTRTSGACSGCRLIRYLEGLAPQSMRQRTAPRPIILFFSYGSSFISV